MLDVKPHVLRYWESQFEQLAPAKNRAGNRIYRPQDIEFITQIRHLVHEERFTIEGARQQLQSGKEGSAAKTGPLTLPERALFASLRTQLEGIRDLLTPPAMR